MAEYIKRVAELLRVSTQSVEQSESPEAQLLYIREEIRRRSQGPDIWVDSGLSYEDELTGAVVLDRPGVKRLLADARAGKFEVLAMKSIQRLGRDTLGMLQIKRMMDDCGVELVALQDGYFSFRDPELIFLVHADRAQAGREDISRNVRTAMRQRAKQGKWMAGNVPFGYRRKNRHELEPHPETAPILREIFRLRRMGWGANRIVGHLNESQIPSPSWWEAAGRVDRLQGLAATDERYADQLERCRKLVDRRPKWTTKTLRLILQSTAYYGELGYYRKFWRVRIGGKKVIEHRPAEDHITVPCPPLITRDEWQEAQEVNRTQKRVDTRDRAGHVYLLSGVLFCGRCGGRMNGGGGHVGKYGWYSYYHCQNRRDQQTCDQPSAREQALEDAVLHDLPKVLMSVPEQSQEPTVNQDDTGARIRQIEAELADLADEKRYYRNEHRRKRVSDSELDAELARITAAEQPLRAALDRAKGQAELPDVIRREREKLRQFAAEFATLQASSDPDERRQLRIMLQSAVERIVYRGPDDYDIHLRLVHG